MTSGNNMSRRLDNFPRFWAMIIVVATIVAGTIVTLGYLSGQVERQVEIHDGAYSSHRDQHKRYILRHELPNAVRHEITRIVSPRLDRIDRQQRAQWRVIREVLAGDRAAARRALPNPGRDP
jgi:hypothetical protein